MNSIPLIQNVDKQSINTSIIALKKEIQSLDNLLAKAKARLQKLENDDFLYKSDVVDVVQSGNMNPVTSNAVVPSDVVAIGNMQSVSSNAVAQALGTNYDDSQMQNITSQVIKYVGVESVYAYRKQNMVYLYFSGVYTGTPTSGTQGFVGGLPSKYRPSQQFNGFAMGGYNGNGAIFGRGSVEVNGSVMLQETAWTNGAAIRSCVVYFVN